jgi:F-type H+-transporting ATPase subunit a
MNSQMIFKRLIILYLVTIASISGLLASEGKGYDPVGSVMHHISNSNEFHVVGDLTIPLPCIVYSKDQGFKTFMSSAFHHGTKAIDGYVLQHGSLKKIAGEFPMGEVELANGHEGHDEHGPFTMRKEGKKELNFLNYQGKEYALEGPSKLTGMTSWFDFSITKNVFGMLIAALLLILIFTRVASYAKSREGKAPTGIQNFIEPIFTFIRDEVAKPVIGPKYEKYLPYLMTLFFFILFCNLMGLIPFFPGGMNITGNIATTMVLAVITFFVVNFSGNKHYWQHVLWMPGLPLPVKLLITPIEIIGLFTRPFSLMIRLFANITAGHIIILSLVGLIFIFGKGGESIGGAMGGAAVAVPFTIFMNLIELLVAFIQAFIFTMLSASYIGAAVEEGHHDDHH